MWQVSFQDKRNTCCLYMLFKPVITASSWCGSSPSSQSLYQLGRLHPPLGCKWIASLGLMTLPVTAVDAVTLEVAASVKEVQDEDAT